METKIRLIEVVICSLAFFCACGDEGRIDQIDDSIPAPGKVTIKSVTSRPGGAVIKYSIPNDDNLAGVKVVYERNGETCENMSSRFVDSLIVEGFGDTKERKARVYGVGVNGKLSDVVPVTITPLTPAVHSAKIELHETFGGISAFLSNNASRANLSIVLLRDTLLSDAGKPASEIEWDEFYTFHTSAEKILLARRGLEGRTMLYGVYLRDRWNNVSDIFYKELTPVEEIKLPTVTWKNMALPTDTWQPAEGLYSWYDISHLWDGNYHGDSNAWASPNGPRSIWFTIDLGYTAKLSRMQIFHRQYEVYSGSAERHFQVYGSENPNPDGSWDDSWFLLGDFQPLKPSGYQEDGSVGTITDEDRQYWTHTNEFVFEATEEVVNPYREIRYLRMKLLDTFESYGIEADYEIRNQYVIGEIVLHGQMPNQEEKDKYYTEEKS